MTTLYTGLEEGARLDITVEFVGQQTIDDETARVSRLLVTDQSGAQFTILVDPDVDELPDFRSGATYTFTALLGAVPLDRSVNRIDECPHCEGTLRRGQIVDAIGPAIVKATQEQGLDEPFGVVDAETALSRVRDDADLVDDWTPMQNSGDIHEYPPDYVCESCGRHVDAHELRPDSDHPRQFNDHHIANAAPARPATADSQTLGLATGGAKDVANFRDNIANGYTPQPEAIADEGLFYDYYFETGDREDSDALFAPRYAAAASEHPLTGEVEQYLSVGLDSTLSVSEFERPRLDLVAVLDVSGSMGSPFDVYYYDEHGRKREVEDDSTTKMEAATLSLCALTEQLHDDDRLGVVLYNSRAHVAKPLRDVGSTDMIAIRRHIRDVAAGGGTNLAGGFEAAASLFDENGYTAETERRVVFMTDMMPNRGMTDEDGLTRLFADAATDGIHTTFVGMGLDANAELADALSGIRGANHYFIHSAAEFERRLGEEFDYMVTPLVYDLNLELDADGYEIAAVHGSPSANAATDRLMHVGTLFPSARRDGEARGGVVLVRLERTASDGNLELAASWTERDGGEHTERVSVALPDGTETFAHDGVRKAIGLARYAAEIRAWARTVHERDGATGVDDWQPSDGRGRQRGEHERESVPLFVSGQYADRFDRLREYLEGEMAAVGDETMEQELELLERLCLQRADA